MENDTQNDPNEVPQEVVEKMKIEAEKSEYDIFHVLILDKSGSMQDVKKETINGFNEQIQTIKKLQDRFTSQKHNVTLATFNDDYCLNYLCEPSATAEELNDSTYTPNSGTALLDGIVFTINNVKEEIKKRGLIDKYKVLVTILTDGEENSSKEYRDPNYVANLIKDMTGEVWQFAYMGCTADTLEVAKSLGVSFTNTSTYSTGTVGTMRAFNKMSNSRVAFCAVVDDNLSLTTSYSANSVSDEVKDIDEVINSIKATNTTTTQDNTTK